jgi:hypothetical protein
MALQKSNQTEEIHMATRPRLPAAKMVTAKGLAHFAYIDKPDTEGQYADGKYKITLSFPEGHEFLDTLSAKVAELVQQQWGANPPANMHNPIKIGSETTMDSMAGRVFIRAKSNKAPVVVDSQKQALTNGVTVFGGDTVKVALTLAVYDGAQKGVTAYLDAVQLIEKRSAGTQGADMFGLEDGFVAEAGESNPVDSFDDDDDL